MVKTLVSLLSVAVILFVGAIYESNFVNKQFREFDQVLEVLYQKTDEKIAVEEDVYAVQNNWLRKKKHICMHRPDACRHCGLRGDGPTRLCHGL